MRNIAASTVTALFILICSCNQKAANTNTTVITAVNDVIQENLKGNVKQIKTESYLIDSTGKTGAANSKTEEDFDDKGYTNTFISQDSVSSKNTFVHNANGLLTEMKATMNGKNKSALKLEFDKEGKYTRATSFDSTGKMDVYYENITLNKFGQVTGAKGYHPDSTLKMTFNNNFDSVYYVGGSSHDSVGNVTYSSKITLNDKKDPARTDETTVTKGASKNTVTTYTYDGWDKYGNWTQQTSFNDKGKPIKIVKRSIEYQQ